MYVANPTVLLYLKVTGNVQTKTRPFSERWFLDKLQNIILRIRPLKAELVSIFIFTSVCDDLKLLSRLLGTLNNIYTAKCVAYEIFQDKIQNKNSVYLMLKAGRRKLLRHLQ